MSDRTLSYRRPVFAVIESRLREPRRFMQVLAGPRQSGKSTLAQQVTDELQIPVRFSSADDPVLRDRQWLADEWEAARRLTAAGDPAVIVLDEVHKITQWSEAVKRLWDEDTRAHRPLLVLILGSSPLLMQRGLTESLAGRFEIIRVPHWSYGEMRDAFGWDLDRFVCYGGFPGAAGLVDDLDRWRTYVRDSLIETTISRDVLLLQPIQKPALLRLLFGLACQYSAQVVSYAKLVGQLQDAGNTTTLAHYLELLDGAGMMRGLQRYSGSAIRRRASSPKLLALNTALVTAVRGLTLAQARADPGIWGRLIETAVGAHLARDVNVELMYWRDGVYEVDYVARSGRYLLAIEVASGAQKDGLPGLRAFREKYERARPLLVGAQGMSLEDFLLREPRSIIEPS